MVQQTIQQPPPSVMQRFLRKVLYRPLLAINGGDRALTRLDLAYLQRLLLGIAPDPNLRPVCKLWWPEKIALVLDGVRQTQSVPGNIVELGAYKGGATLLMAEALQELGNASPASPVSPAPHSDKWPSKSASRHRQLLAFDSFCGYPAPGERDRMDNGKFHYAQGHHGDTSLAYVDKVLRLYGVRDFVSLYKGWLELALPVNVSPSDCFSLVLLDCNHYASAHYALNFFYDKLSPGGIFFVDDYRRPEQPYHPEAPGIKKAVDEFLSDKPEVLTHGAYSMWSFTKV